LQKKRLRVKIGRFISTDREHQARLMSGNGDRVLEHGPKCEAERREMVARQIRSGIGSRRVAKALEVIPRNLFPAPGCERAADVDPPVGRYGQEHTQELDRA
jgi:hypothetical protein